MNNLIKYIVDNVSNNNELKKTDKNALNQTQRNALVKDIGLLLAECLKNYEVDGIEILPLKNGVGISCDNEKLGFIPIEISVKIPNLETDLVVDSEEYFLGIELKAQKKAEQEKAKAEKTARDKQERELKALLKAKKLEELQSKVK